VPLSAWGKGDWRPPEGRVDPAVDMRTAVREQVDRMPVADYFGLLARLMETNPPAAADAPAVARMARVGIVPGRPFDAAKLPQGALDRARGAALERIKAQARELEFRNGWILTTGTGVYGTDYPQRAFVTAIGLGANRPQDAVYPVTHSDGDGRRLNGANRYVLRFPPSETPDFCARYRPAARQPQEAGLGAPHVGFRTMWAGPAPGGGTSLSGSCK
jgi:hypothetical protein